MKNTHQKCSVDPWGCHHTKTESNIFQRLMKKSEKMNQKRQNWGSPSGCRPVFGCQQPVLKSSLKHCFSDIFLVFGWKISEEHLKKYFDQLLGVPRTQKLVKINSNRFKDYWAQSQVVRNIREILYKRKNQTALKQLRRPKGRQLSEIQQFVFILLNSILLNLLSCLPFGFPTGFSSFSKLAEPSP